MKNIIKLSLLAVLAIPAMVGCGGKGGSKEDLEQSAKTATAEVGVAYSGYSSSEGLGLAGAKLITEYTVGDAQFKLEYSVAAMAKAYTIEYLKIEEEKLVVEIPTFAELEEQGFSGATYAAYKLSAKVTYLGAKEGAKEQFSSYIDKEIGEGASWNIRINAETTKPVWQKIADARLKESGETVVTTGYVTAIMNPVQDAEYQNGVWLADGANGIMLYGSSLTAYFGAIHIGDMLMVIGPASPYNGLFEVKNPTIAFVENAPQEIVQPVWTEIGESELGSYTAVNANDPVIIKNATITTDVSEMTAVDSKAITLSVKVGSKTISYYLNKHTNTAHRQAVIDLIKANAGKTVTIKSILGWNNNALQITGCCIADDGGIVNSLTFAA